MSSFSKGNPKTEEEEEKTSVWNRFFLVKPTVKIIVVRVLSAGLIIACLSFKFIGINSYDNCEWWHSPKNLLVFQRDDGHHQSPSSEQQQQQQQHQQPQESSHYNIGEDNKPDDDDDVIIITAHQCDPNNNSFLQWMDKRAIAEFCQLSFYCTPPAPLYEDIYDSQYAECDNDFYSVPWDDKFGGTEEYTVESSMMMIQFCRNDNGKPWIAKGWQIQMHSLCQKLELSKGVKELPTGKEFKVRNYDDVDKLYMCPQRESLRMNMSTFGAICWIEQEAAAKKYTGYVDLCTGAFSPYAVTGSVKEELCNHPSFLNHSAVVETNKEVSLSLCSGTALKDLTHEDWQFLCEQVSDELPPLATGPVAAPKEEAKLVVNICNPKKGEPESCPTNVPTSISQASVHEICWIARQNYEADRWGPYVICENQYSLDIMSIETYKEMCRDEFTEATMGTFLEERKKLQGTVEIWLHPEKSFQELDYEDWYQICGF